MCYLAVYMFLSISQQGIRVWTIEPCIIGKRALKHQSPKPTFILPCNTKECFWPSLHLGKGINHRQNLCLHTGMSLLLAVCAAVRWWGCPAETWGESCLQSDRPVHMGLGNQPPGSPGAELLSHPLHLFRQMCLSSAVASGHSMS